MQGNKTNIDLGPSFGVIIFWWPEYVFHLCLTTFMLTRLSLCVPRQNFQWISLNLCFLFLFSSFFSVICLCYFFYCFDTIYLAHISSASLFCFQSHHPNPTVYQEKNKKIKVILAIISLVILKISRFLSISQKSFLFFKLKYGLFTIFCYSRVYSNIIHVYIIHMYAYFSDSFPL